MRKWMIDHCWREEDVEHFEGIDYGYPKPAAWGPMAHAWGMIMRIFDEKCHKCY